MAEGLKDPNKPDLQFPNSLKFMENSFLSFLQAIFSSFPPDRNCFHFSDDPDKTEIKIEGQNTDNLKTVDTRPKIVVARGSVSVETSGINNQVGSQNVSLQKRKYATIRSGTVGISCYSRSDIEADQIAEICADTIESLASVIRQACGFLEVRSLAIGQRAMIKSDAIPELFVTPVLIKVKLTKNYTVEITDPVKLRKIIYGYIIEPVGLVIETSSGVVKGV